jgi:hypothetical protein
MTSPSRRKRPTTQPSSPRTNDIVLHIKPRPPVAECAPTRGKRRAPNTSSICNLQSRVRVAACVFAMTVLAANLFAETGGSTLEWRRGKSATTKKHVATSSAPVARTSVEATRSSNSIRSTGKQPVATTRVTQLNPLRGQQRRFDAAIRPAALEDDGGPHFKSNSGSGTQYRSMIVERDEEDNGLRAAQLSSPSSPAGSAGDTDTFGVPAATDDGAATDADLRNPIMDTTSELPPLEDPSAQDIEQQTDQDQLQPPFEDQQRQPGTQLQQQPSTEFQPRVPVREPVSQLPPTPPLNEDTVEAERQKSEQACADGFADLREKTIDKLNLTISVTGEEGSDYPFECTIDEGAWHGGRCWEQTCYTWKASALCHKPLYFEDEQLERYGHSWSPCFQPFISGAHFFCTLPVLPYCMGVEPPCECIYALGHYRPGNCAPYMCNPIPISPRGALFQAGAVVGTAAALP